VHRWTPLVAICTGTFMLLVDITIINVALPDVAADLRTTFDELQWVVDAYALSLAALVLGAGSLADLYGRRRIYLLGLLLFALASLACGLAPDAGVLVAARALQGIGGAAMLATTIALINTSYQGPQRGVAFGVWGAVSGAAASLGPILGGALTQLSWRWIFFVNLPLCVLAVVLTLQAVQESRQPGAPRPDVLGIVLFTAGAGGVVLGLVRAGAGGWAAPDARVPLLTGAALLVLWVWVELRRHEPMLDVRLFRSRSFTGIMAGAALLSGAFAANIYISLWLQSVLGLSPLLTGVIFLPLALSSLVVSAAIGGTIERIPPRFVVGIGLLLTGVGELLLVRVDAGGNWGVLVSGFTVLGVGVGLATPTLASAALASVPPERSGMASGAVNTARQLGFALGVAALAGVFTARAADVLQAGGAADPSGTAVGLSAGQAGRLMGAADDGVRGPFADLIGSAFALGLREVVLACGLAGLLGGVLVIWLVRAPAPQPREAAVRRGRHRAPVRRDVRSVFIRSTGRHVSGGHRTGAAVVVPLAEADAPV
jgi:EmrB/QacA subfamily drug resistance transporter